jgi:hypothetical protein
MMTPFVVVVVVGGGMEEGRAAHGAEAFIDRKSTRLNSSH